MKQKKRVWSNFELFEGDALAEYLEMMAKKGWMLASLGTILTFKRIPPANFKFTVDIMNNSSVFDSLKNEKLLGLREICEDAGWEFVCTNGMMQVFVSENPNINPIQTDSELKSKRISKNVISKTVPIYLLLLFMCSFQLIFFGDVIVSLWSNLSLSIIISYLYVCTLCIFQLTTILIWYIKSRIAINKGNKINYPKFRTVKIRSNIIIATLILYVLSLLTLIFNAIKQYNFLIWIYLIFAVCYGIMFILLRWILKLLREKYNFSRKCNRLIYIFCVILTTIVMSVIMIFGTVGVIGSIRTNRVSEQTSILDAVISFKHVGYETGVTVEHVKEESILASRESYEERGMIGKIYNYIDYVYYTSNFNYPINIFKNNHLKQWKKEEYIHYEKVNIEGFIVEECYLQPCTYNLDTSEIHSYEYLIKNEKSLLLLKVTEKLTDNQLIELVGRMQ